METLYPITNQCEGTRMTFWVFKTAPVIGMILQFYLNIYSAAPANTKGASHTSSQYARALRNNDGGVL